VLPMVNQAEHAADDLFSHHSSFDDGIKAVLTLCQVVIIRFEPSS
jgi:hypothetical protein